MANFELLSQLERPDKLISRLGFPDFFYYVLISFFGFNCIYFVIDKFGNCPIITKAANNEKLWKVRLIYLMYAVFCSIVSTASVIRQPEIITKPFTVFNSLTHNLVVVSYGYYLFDISRIISFRNFFNKVNLRLLLHHFIMTTFHHIALQNTNLISLLVTIHLTEIFNIFFQISLLCQYSCCNIESKAFRLLKSVKKVLAVLKILTVSWVIYHSVKIEEDLGVLSMMISTLCFMIGLIEISIMKEGSLKNYDDYKIINHPILWNSKY